MRRSFAVLSVCVIGLGFAAGARAQVVFGQVDDFQSGTILNWSNGIAGDPTNVPSGGPLGVGDHFMQVLADGSGPGGKISAYNRTQWIGDYGDAMITRIEADFRVISGGPLTMRFALKSDTFNGAPGYVSTVGAVIPADGLWHHASFDLDVASLIGLSSPAPLGTFLNGVAEARFLHSLAPSLTGDQISATVGIDNIVATAVPEPTSLALLSVAGLGWLIRRRRNCG